MKVGIILSGNIESQPYISYYTDVFDKIDMDYEYIGWDRDNANPSIYNNHKLISINVKGSVKNNNFRKLYDYWLFSKEVKKYLANNHFDFLLIHTIVNGVFLKKYLLKNYRNKYVFDIRDYSPIFPFVKSTVKKIIRNSFFTTISSEGFLEWLPKENKYVLGHNVSRNNLVVSFYENKTLILDKKELMVLTIGKIRDFSSNARVIVSLGNKSRIKVFFAGSGIESKKLEKFSRDKFSNVFFLGLYKKAEERSIVNSSDFINIILPINTLSNTLTSNRFYLALTLRKIMIVNEESFHAKYVKKYNLGIVIQSGDDIFQKIMDYVLVFDCALLEKGCKELLNLIESDILSFEEKVASITESNKNDFYSN